MLPDFRNPKPEDVVVSNPNDLEISPVHLTVTSRRKQSRALASPFILLYAFASLVFVGTVLLMLPVSSHGEGFTPIMDAFFTATSAVTVTGLVIQNTAVYWTRVGQIFIENAILGKGITISGDGNESLDFTYIDDLTSGIEKVIKNKNSINQIFNWMYEKNEGSIAGNIL